MLILFAVGVVTGTILSLRARPAVAGVHGDVRRRVRARVRASRASRSSSRRSSSRSTCTAGTASRRARTSLVGIPIVARRDHRLVHGDLGQRLDEPPDRASRSANGEVVDVAPAGGAVRQRTFWHELDAHVPRRLHRGRVPGRGASTRARWLRGRPRPLRTASALVVALTLAALAAPAQVVVGDWAARDGGRASSRSSSRRSRACGTRAEGAPRPRLVRRHGRVRHRDPEAALAARVPRPERDGRGARHGAAGRSAAGRRREALASRRWSGSARCSRCSARGSSGLVAAQAPARVAVVLPRGGRGRPARRVVALIAGWVDDRGRPPAVGRLPGDAHRRRP